jgi:glycolate oxidase FAD binding subunit
MQGSVTTRKPQIVWAELEAIVGAEHLRTAGPNDAVAGLQPLRVAEPADAQQVAQALSWANANHLAVAPRGSGTKTGWGNPPEQLDVVISTRRLDRVVEHAWADMTATVEAGCTLSRLQELLAGHGQRLALDALWPERATIGGVLATNDSGSLRIRFGALRDLVIGVTVALPDGTLARSGGKVVKNVAGYDLPKLMTGSFGTLAIITQAIFRLHPLPHEARTFEIETPTAEAADRIILSILDSQLAFTGLQMCTSDREAPRVHVRLEGIEAGILAQTAQLANLTSGTAHAVDNTIWHMRESLWDDGTEALVCKISALPSQLGAISDQIAKLSSRNASRWQLLAQATGVATLRLDGSDAEAMIEIAQSLRSELKAQGGSLVVLRQPAAAKDRLETWGTPGSALPLMQRIKAQFDPQRTLNPGRFVGGI